MSLAAGLVLTAGWLAIAAYIIARRLKHLSTTDAIAVSLVLALVVPAAGWGAWLDSRPRYWTPASIAVTSEQCDRMRAIAPAGAVYYKNDQCVWVAWDQADSNGVWISVETATGWIPCDRLLGDVARGVLDGPDISPCHQQVLQTSGVGGFWP